MAMSTPLHQLGDHGQSVWIDFLSRELLRGGQLARMMREDAVSGVTSNPTIFQKAISAGDAYDEQLCDVVETDDDLKETFIQLASKMRRRYWMRRAPDSVSRSSLAARRRR